MAIKKKPEPKNQTPPPQQVEEDDDKHEGEEEEEDEEEEEEEEEEIEEEEEESEDETSDEEEEDEDAEAEEEEEEEEKKDEKEEFSDRDSIRNLLEPFGKDQLIELLKEAALKNPSLLSRIASSADSDPVHRKIFVHGLGWDATSDSLTAAFASFGPLEECKAVLDRATGRCKGYGFVLFRTRAAAQCALKEPQKKIGNRIVSCQLASFGAPGSQSGGLAVPDATGRKLYVSNVGEHIQPERLSAFFAQFGEIEEGPVGYDRATGNLRGYALFVYKTPEGCMRALEEPKKIFEGCELNCQRAIEVSKQKNQATMDSSAPAMLQSNDLSLSYPAQSLMGLNPVATRFMVQGLNPTVGLLGQNAGLGFLGPGVSASTMSPSLRRSSPPPYAVGLGLGGVGTGINSISPSIIGTYASPSALQGLGAYQNNQLPSSTGMKSQSGIGPAGTGYASYLGR